MISSRLMVNIEQFYFLLLSYLVSYQIWLNYFENNCHFGYITKSLKAPGFKPSGVQVKLLPALCYWAWLGVFANSLSVGSAVVCPNSFINFKIKRKSIQLFLRFILHKNQHIFMFFSPLQWAFDVFSIHLIMFKNQKLSIDQFSC